MRYGYSLEGDLPNIADSTRGTTRYQVDDAHRLIAEITPSGEHLHYEFDAANNLIRTPWFSRLSILAGNRAGATSTEVFEYDRRDRMVLRRHRDGPLIRYRYYDPGFSLAVAAVVTAVFLAPESEMIDEAKTPLETDAKIVLSLLDSAQERLVDDDPEAALADMLYAAELVETLDRDSQTLQAFCVATVETGDQMHSAGYFKQARLLFAIAVRYAEYCPDLDAEAIRFRQANTALDRQVFATTKPGM